MSRHRSQPVRPRYGRIVAVSASVLVTLTALLGGVGILPTDSPRATAVAASIAPFDTRDDPGEVPGDAPDALADAEVTPPKTVADPEVIPSDPSVAPAESGEGRRVVFSQDQQRVWLVGDDNDVQRSYQVSGSIYDNLDPGTYAVYSRSEHAWGIEDSGTMDWFVRFARGDNAAIGFHDIPVDNGRPIQSEAQLGTPLSHGCIRQRTADAKALWDFAPIGTPVVVI